MATRIARLWRFAGMRAAKAGPQTRGRVRSPEKSLMIGVIDIINGVPFFFDWCCPSRGRIVADGNRMFSRRQPGGRPRPGRSRQLPGANPGGSRPGSAFLKSPKHTFRSMRLYYSFVTGIAGWLGVAYY